jgi:hypothetical protein
MSLTKVALALLVLINDTNTHQHQVYNATEYDGDYKRYCELYMISHLTPQDYD